MINNKQLIIYFVASLILVGCATITTQQQTLINESVPMCSGEKECELKWAAARKWIINNARWKIQIYSDDLIETYNPTPDSQLLAARVTKEPTPNGGYSFIVYVWCNNIFGCIPKKVDALIGFNNYVNSVKVEDDSFYKESLKQSSYSKPKIGIHLLSINNKIIIKGVNSGSPASKAGLQTQDIILSLKGKSVTDLKTFFKVIEDIEFGDKARIEINRNGDIHSRTLEFPTKKEIEKLASSNTDVHVNVQNDIEGKLESLSRLLEKDLITQEEFDKKKKELLEEY
jgi:hypothetical protein